MLALDRSGSATNYLPSTILHFTFVQTLIENPLSCEEDEHGVGWERGWIWVGGNWEGRRIIAKCIIYVTIFNARSVQIQINIDTDFLR